MIKIHELDSYNKLLLSHPHIVAAHFQPIISPDVDDETRKAAEYLANRAGACLAAIMQMARVVEDMQTTYRMISRYPWKSKHISKSKHLDLTWFLFQNLCYKYPEKIKLYFNVSRPLCELLHIETPTWLKEQLRKTQKEFSRDIRDRGNTVHSWDVLNSDIETFDLVSFFHNLDADIQNFDLPHTFHDLDGHYRDAKWMLKIRAEKLISAAESALVNILEHHKPTPITIVGMISDILHKVNQGEVVLSTKKK